MRRWKGKATLPHHWSTATGDVTALGGFPTLTPPQHCSTSPFRPIYSFNLHDNPYGQELSVCRKRTWLQAFHPINTIRHPQLLSWITRSSNHSAFTHSGPGLPHALRHYFAPSNTAFCAPPYYLALCSRDINISLHSAFVFVTLNKFRTITSMHLQTNPLLCNISEHVLDLFWLQLSLFSSVMYPKEDCSQLILR